MSAMTARHTVNELAGAYEFGYKGGKAIWPLASEWAGL